MWVLFCHLLGAVS